MALENRLAVNNRQGVQALTSTLSVINEAVAKNLNQRSDVAVLQQSQQITSRTKSIVDTLHIFQLALRAAAHEAAIGALHHPDAGSQSVRITPRQLARQLDRYTAFIRNYIPGAPALTQTSPVPEGTTWLYANQSPVAAALASLTRLEAQVRRQAMEALSSQAQKVGNGCDLCFDRIGAMAVAESNTVAPGTEYEAQLFLTSSASGYRLKMSAEGKAIEVQPSGRGLVEIRVPPLRPGQPDTVRAQWQGNIQVQKGLTDTTLRVNAPYFIVKPHAQ